MRERVNPRVNRDVPEQEIPNPGVRNERAEDLHLMFQSEGWRNTVVPSLRARIADIERRLATDRQMSQENWRVLQTTHALLTDIVQEPADFFLGDRNR